MQVGSGESGGGIGKWPLVALAAGGGVAALLLLTRESNTAPVPGTVVVSPGGIGMAGVTSFSFGTQASRDPDGDNLTFNWNFGDGSTGTGATTAHTYATAGTFTVALDVGDGTTSVAAPSATVTVAASVAGTWAGGATEPGFGSSVSLTLTQSGGTLGGTMTLSGNVAMTLSSVTGTVSPLTYPAAISFTSPTFTVSNQPGSFVISYSGIVNSATSMTGTIVNTNPALAPPSLSASMPFSR